MSIPSKKPIKFGTDGWRGIIAADFTFERVQRVAIAAAYVLKENYADQATSDTVIVGYDRRFLANEFALAAAEAIQGEGFTVKLANCFSPTPALSYAAHHQKALGAIAMTASHNPAGYLGLKVKGAFGGSVSGEITAQIEAKLDAGIPPSNGTNGSLEYFDPWADYCDGLQRLVDVEAIRGAIAAGKLEVFADVMYGAASGGLTQLLNETIQEVHCDPDPLFGGRAPEPLEKNLSQLKRVIRSAQAQNPEAIQVGFVFDGDSDRIAAVDSAGNFLSSQKLIPVLLAHLSQNRGYGGEVVKTVSGSDLIPLLSESFNLPLFETPIGYKYIAERMLDEKVLLGGEESGGIGYGHHIPERDALLAALYVLEAIATSGKDLGDIYQGLLDQVGFSSVYDRIDLHLKDFSIRDRLLSELKDNTPTTIADKKVLDCNTKDGYKFRLADQSWLLIRFSGTEPVLRLYCEAPTIDDVNNTLAWAKTWAESFN
ncbi:phosphoglucomutase/phosphomannomutase family protein [[Limnothrix rosea] IAM M-220]|uniref:phosphoglucomutase/phosphomannomutase family protein n=1 Tax=[Limnothrix rosea] IAM M-220 TaxID=454133 RepID=UPI00095B806B|nr:phosphoglucomutase/phosphomannomutase family protein [[Limnothrix rosea] IAM M-220]OKH15078.1 phosphoglucosamine mutase [[Limnothrix rosea] IAM M-220]